MLKQREKFKKDLKICAFGLALLAKMEHQESELLSLTK